MVLQTLLTRDHIRDIYRERVATQENGKRDEGRRFLHQHHVVTYLSIMEHAQKFSRQITDTLDASVRHNGDWHPSEAADAFLALEKYALNLLDFPWKTEFKTVKLCGGFYQAQVSPQLRQAMYIFMLMGYEKATEEILVLKQQPTSYDSLVYVACECFLAAVECLIMAQIWEKIGEQKYPILDVYKSRMEVCGDAERCATWVLQHCTQQKRPATERHVYNSFNSYHHNFGMVNSGGARPKSNAYINNANSIDPQSNNSLLRSQKSRNNTSSTSNKKSSRESRDSGYGSKSVSKELPEVVPGRQRSEEIAPEDLYGHSAQTCDNNAARLSQDNHELYLTRDCHTGGKLQADSARGPGVPSGGDDKEDVLVARTMDDHLRQSERYLKELEVHAPNRGPLTSTRSLDSATAHEKGGPYDEWSDVRDKLRQDFGDKYFEGERGDTILKPEKNKQQDKSTKDIQDGKKTDRKPFQNVDVIRGDISTMKHSKVEYGPAEKYSAPMAAVSERARQAAARSGTGVSHGKEDAKVSSSPPKPGLVRQNSAEDQRRFDNAVMVKEIVESSSVFKKLAAERSPSEESVKREITKSTESIRSKDASPTESVHSTVGELIDFSEAKVLHQMGCKFMPELRARPHGAPKLTAEERQERKEKKEKRKKEKEKELKAEETGGEKSDPGKPVGTTGEGVNGTKDAEPRSLDKKAEPPVPTSTSSESNKIESTSKPTVTSAGSSSSSRPIATAIAPPDDILKRDPLSPIVECRENGEHCDNGASNSSVVKKEILTNDVISNANIITPSNNSSNGSSTPQRDSGPSSISSSSERGTKSAPPAGQTSVPIYSTGIKGSCIAGHAALTNNTISSHAVTGHSPRCPVHGTPGVPHPLIAIQHPHVPPGHIVMCSAGHAHIAPGHVAAVSQISPHHAPIGPKEVPCPKPPPPPTAPKPNVDRLAAVKSIDNRRSLMTDNGLDIVASSSNSRQPPAPPPRVSSALSEAKPISGSISDLPPPPPELLSDIHAPPPDLVSNHTPPSHTARGHPGHGQYHSADYSGTSPKGASGHLPTAPPSYEAATGMCGHVADVPDGVYVEANAAPPWQCKACTFANKASSKVCDMCGKSRRQGPEAAPLLSGGSQCPRCTYVNAIGSLMCKVCMQDLQGSPTYI